MILFLNLCTIYLHTNTLKNSYYRRIREKYEMEMRDLERSEQQALEKYNEMKARSCIIIFKQVWNGYCFPFSADNIVFSINRLG